APAGAREASQWPLSPATGGLGGSAAGYFPKIIGDQSPFAQQIPLPPPAPPPPVRPPKIPSPSASSLLVPSVRTFKIADNQSPRPMDRVFFNFNFFENL